MPGLAYFFRNVDDIDELNKKTLIAKVDNDEMQKFRIVEKISLEESDFMIFQKSLMKTYIFIKDITYKLTMNSNAEYLCALVISEKFDYGILVNSSGYSYPRTVAILKLGEEYGI